MKASEVLKRYAEGRRNFRGENLRGLSFKGKDLSGADFSEADIRGTNFRGAILRGTKFTDATAGLQKRWATVVFITSFAFLLTLSLMEGSFTAAWTRFLIFHSQAAIIAGIMSFAMIIGFVVAIRDKVLNPVVVNVLGSFTGVIAVIAITLGVFMGNGVGSELLNQTIENVDAAAGSVAAVITFIFAVTFSTVAVIASTISFTIFFSITGAVIISIFSINSLLWVSILAVIITVNFVFQNKAAILISNGASLIMLITILFLSIYIALQAIAENKNYKLIRELVVTLATFNGTSFYNADLTNTEFSKTTLKNVDLRTDKLDCICWHESKKIAYARVDNTVLAQPHLRELLVTKKGIKQSFLSSNLRRLNLIRTDLSHANLEQANLSQAILRGANLSYANLKQANLSQAILQGANLEGAILTETNCVGTDFTQATLTAARLEAWNIDSTTILEQVNCDYVFLREKPNAKGSLERRPHHPDAVFQPGDFEKLYRQIMNTVEILLRNGMNPDAFRQAFNQLIGEHPEIDYDSIQSIEKKGNDVLVTLEVSEETDKGQVERQFLEVYEARLEAVKQTALLEAEVRHNQDLTQIIHQALLERSPNSTVNLNNTIQQETKNMSDNQDINTRDVKGNLAGSVGGDFDASGAILNIDNVNSSVSNSINQLPPTTQPEKPGIKELLEQLQMAISNSSELSEDDKVQALEQVKTLAEAGQKPENGEMQKKAKRAMGFLKVILDELPTVTSLVKKCQEILPAIATFFGLG